MVHGSWHFLACVAMLLMALGLCEATTAEFTVSVGKAHLCGRSFPALATTHGDEEGAASILMYIMSFSLLIIEVSGGGPDAFIWFWLIFSFASVPFLLWCLGRVTRRHTIMLRRAVRDSNADRNFVTPFAAIWRQKWLSHFDSDGDGKVTMRDVWGRRDNQSQQTGSPPKSSSTPVVPMDGQKEREAAAIQIQARTRSVLSRAKQSARNLVHVEEA